MKYLSDYTEEGISKALEENGAFFAFGMSQFNEKKKEGVEYVSLSGGLICPKENAEKLVESISNNHDLGLKKDIEENGIDNIIQRELGNHEAFYDGNWNRAFEALKDSGYEITKDQVKAKYYELLKLQAS